MGLLFFCGDVRRRCMGEDNEARRRQARAGAAAPTIAAGGEKMIFNMAGYVIQETAEPQTAAPDTETAAEAEPPQEA